jgi:thiol-disulfide isomerase/thioredoxin
VRRGILATVLLGLIVAVLAGVALTNLVGNRQPLGVAGQVAPQRPVDLSDRLPATAKRPLPEVTLPGLAARSDVALTGYRGRPLVINLWATWCAPCVDEMPAFQQVAAAAQGKVAFLGVNVADDPDAAMAFADRLGITYDLAVDPRQDFFHRVSAYGMPTTLLVDRQAMIVYRHTGPLDASALRRLLVEHLAVRV